MTERYALPEVTHDMRKRLVTGTSLHTDRSALWRKPSWLFLFTGLGFLLVALRLALFECAW